MNRLFIIILLLCFYNTIGAQECRTMEINRALIEKMGTSAYLQKVNCSGWFLQQSYSDDPADSCGADCSYADNLPPSGACNSGKYRIPVKAWIIADNNGLNQAASASDVAQYIGHLNTYFDCCGLPFEIFESTDSPEIIMSTDLNSFDTSSGDGDDAFVRSNHYLDNVINLYIPSLEGSGNPNCSAYAYLPTGASGFDMIVAEGSCISSSITNVCSNTEVAAVLIHEFGHYLGLFHTHETDPFISGTQSWEDPDGSNCCSTGDLICDTDADPDFSGAESPTGCVPSRIGNTCSFDLSTCAHPVSLNAYANPPNTFDNIMSYNNLVGCRNTLSNCQKAKMVDALVCARSNLCDPNANYMANPDLAEMFICVGDPAPSFTATSNCYNWYSAPSGGSLLASSTQSFTPSIGSGPGLLDNLTPGEYFFYVGEVNALDPTSCRQTLKVTVESIPGSPNSPVPDSFSGLINVQLSSNVLAVGECRTIGWWITEAPLNITDQADLDNQLSSANVGGVINSGSTVNHVFQAMTGAPINEAMVSINCESDKTLYATPFISEYKASVPDQNCIVGPLTGGSAQIGPWDAKAAQMNVGAVSCAPNPPLNDPTFTVSVSISDYTGGIGDLTLLIRTFACPIPSLVSTTLAGNGTYSFDDSHFPSGFDPNASGLCVIAYDPVGNTASTVQLEIQLNITYPGTNTIPFPTGIYNDCILGSPVTINCLSTAAPVKLITFSGRLTNQNEVILKWVTANEINNDFFTLEKANDSGRFRELARIDGSGNSTEIIEYQFIDTDPVQGMNFYRLSQTDFDGSLHYYGVVEIAYYPEFEGVVIFPNPAIGDEISIQVSEVYTDILQYAVIDQAGRLMQAGSIKTDELKTKYPVSIHHLTEGIYFIRILNGYQTSVKRLIITR